MGFRCFHEAFEALFFRNMFQTVFHVSLLTRTVRQWLESAVWRSSSLCGSSPPMSWTLPCNIRLPHCKIKTQSQHKLIFPTKCSDDISVSFPHFKLSNILNKNWQSPTHKLSNLQVRIGWSFNATSSSVMAIAREQWKPSVCCQNTNLINGCQTTLANMLKHRNIRLLTYRLEQLSSPC